MSLSKAISMAREEITHISDVTQDEAEEISNFIKRDINDAAEYMMESSSEFSDWLMLDIEVIERKLIELFLSVADKTRVELEQFGVQNRELSLYYSGEITGPGTLQCAECGHRVSFGWRVPAAYRATAAALETLSDPKAPALSIRTRSWQVSRVFSRKPGPSAPNTSATGRSRLPSSAASTVISASPSRPSTR